MQRLEVVIRSAGPYSDALSMGTMKVTSVERITGRMAYCGGDGNEIILNVGFLRAYVNFQLVLSPRKRLTFVIKKRWAEL